MAVQTLPGDGDVAAFIGSVDDDRRRADTAQAVELVTEVTGADPVMWGSAIIGFGSIHYRYDTGREGDTVRVGLSPRKGALTFYGLQDAPESAGLLERLGPHTVGKSCLYLKDLSRVDGDVLRDLVRLAWEHRRETETDG